ncbi:MAG: DoxX family protein [Acidobacteriaceae bacterium]
MKVAYWITTVLVSAAFLFFGFLHITQPPPMVAGIHSLGYPQYFLTIDGIANWLAVLGLLVPGFPRVREWAYAGLVFLLIGAICSHAASHQSFVSPLVVLLFVIASYVLWHRLQPANPRSQSIEGSV